MNCPHCKTELIVREQLRLETLIEHIEDREPSLKDAYSCINESCFCNKEKLVWNSYGDCYGSYKIITSFPNEMSSAINSYARQADIEIYKKGVKKETKFPSWLCLGYLTPVIKHEYKSNYFGEVLSKKYKLFFTRKDINGATVLVVPFWRTYNFLWNQFKENIKYENYKEAFKPSYNRGWESRSFEFVVQKLFWRKFKLSKS